MYDIISTAFSRMVDDGELKPCIAYLEDGMRCLKRTAYHRVLGKDFLKQADDLGTWLADFCRKADDAKVGLVSLYLEMNGFIINTGQWHCGLFGFKTDGGTADLDWLSDWDAEHSECFVLRGMESVQTAFKDLFNKRQPLGIELAGDIATHLVTARFMQLVAAAHKIGKRRFRGLSGTPVYATAHDWDIVHCTQ